jgi:hypothetical protein
MTIQKKIPHEDAFLRALTKELGPNRTPDVINHARMQFLALYKNRKDYQNKALQNHLERSILPGIALYQSILAFGYPQEQALVIMEAAFREWVKPTRKRIVGLGRLPFYFHLMRVMIKPMMIKNFPESGWKIEWKNLDRKLIAFDMKSCFYLDVLMEFGVPELTPMYCWLDDQIYEGVSPYVKWDRTKTLGRGDDCCDFKFIRVNQGEEE